MTDLLAGAAFAWCGAYAVLMLYFCLLAVCRSRDGFEYALSGVACAFLCAYAFCNARHYHSGAPEDSAEWLRRVLVFAGAASVLVLHATCLYAEVTRHVRRWVAGVGYGGALLSVAANTGGVVYSPHLGHRTLRFYALEYQEYRWEPRPTFTYLIVFILAVAVAILFLVVRVYLKGKREALLASLGGLVVTACVVNDILVFEGVRNTIHLSEHGMSAFALGLSCTFLSKHARRSDEVVAEGRTLGRRARALRESYERSRAEQEQEVTG